MQFAEKLKVPSSFQVINMMRIKCWKFWAINSNFNATMTTCRCHLTPFTYFILFFKGLHLMLAQASLSNVFLSYFPFSHATKTIFRHHVDHKHSIDADVEYCFRFFHSPCHVWSSITIFYGLFDAQHQFLTMKIDCEWDMWMFG